jgi:hypothetical protein
MAKRNNTPYWCECGNNDSHLHCLDIPPRKYEQLIKVHGVCRVQNRSCPVQHGRVLVAGRNYLVVAEDR